MVSIERSASLGSENRLSELSLVSLNAGEKDPVVFKKQQDLSGKTTGDFKKTTRSFNVDNRFFGKRMS
mgnify:CR=1 FL=1